MSLQALLDDEEYVAYFSQVADSEQNKYLEYMEMYESYLSEKWSKEDCLEIWQFKWTI